MPPEPEPDAMRERAEKAEAEVRALEDILDEQARRVHRALDVEAELATANARVRELTSTPRAVVRGRALALALGVTLGGALVGALVMPRWAADLETARDAAARREAEVQAFEDERALDAAAVARRARADAAPAPVAASIRVVRATTEAGTIDPRLGDMPELRLPPHDEFGTMTLVTHEPRSLVVGVPLEVPLPNGRELCVVLDGTTDTGRYRVRLLTNRHASGTYHPYRSVVAAPDAPFFVVEPFDGEWLVIAVELDATPSVGPVTTVPVTVSPAMATLRAHLSELGRMLADDPSGPERDAAVFALAGQLVDFDTIAQRIVGPAWDQMPTAQRAEVVSFLWEGTNLARLGRVDGDEIEYAAEEPIDVGTRVVTLVQPRSGARAQPIEVAYDMRETEGTWRVVGMATDDFDLIEGFRGWAHGVVASGGVDRLLEQMGEHRRRGTD